MSGEAQTYAVDSGAFEACRTIKSGNNNSLKTNNLGASLLSLYSEFSDYTL